MSDLGKKDANVPLSNCCARSGEQSSKDSGIKGTTPATSFLPDTSSSSPTKVSTLTLSGPAMTDKVIAALPTKGPPAREQEVPSVELVPI
ncbi:hypothetical protein CTAM01_09657 [Colletotrichum tamarilloi]|uniref:Uncharacterized protein n=1 Tax=Colletotrichum tamarilloi TaxID=1209934 RepID=A0ABQ9R2R4_9PEZI|nr:uncharacterized protein CTAM01_09657 [Colletotrichum tamarilloi]KAK1493030.1 hypothetical protein CTAM01_09657 [Colletotrichum tamarilloi]